MKKFSKLVVIFAMFALMLGALAGCGGDSDNGSNSNAGNEGGNQEVVKLKAGSTPNADHAYNVGLEKFAELINERSDGKIEIEIYPASQLGSERELVEGLQMGTVDITVVSSAPVSGFSDAFLVTDLPFMFKNRDHAYDVLDGEIGQGLLKELEGTGIKGLAIWENGYRNITNSVRPIEVPADMEGIKIRTMENPIHMDSFSQIGADPTPMAFGELFTALQQGTVDAQENPLAIIEVSKFYEVQDNLALTGHVYAAAPMLISQETWDGLSAEDQEMFQKAADEARDFERQLLIDADAELLQKLKDEGMQVTTPDKGPWQEAMAPVYDKWADRIGQDLIDSINEVGTNY